MNWNEFYAGYNNWVDEAIERYMPTPEELCVAKPNEIINVIKGIYDDDVKAKLIVNAVLAKIDFTTSQVLEIVKHQISGEQLATFFVNYALDYNIDLNFKERKELMMYVDRQTCNRLYLTYSNHMYLSTEEAEELYGIVDDEVSEKAVRESYLARVPISWRIFKNHYYEWNEDDIILHNARMLKSFGNDDEIAEVAGFFTDEEKAAIFVQIASRSRGKNADIENEEGAE